MKKKNKTFHSYDQYQLKNLSDLVCDDIEGLLNALGVEPYKVFDKMVTMCCPIHGGDNDSALNLYYKGDSYRGNWKCRTHQCENVFKSSIIGFIRGCLSKNNGWNKEGDDIVSFKDAIDFAIKFTNHDPVNDKQTKKIKEKNAFVNTVRHISTNSSDIKEEVIVPRNLVIKALEIPSIYFLNRGFSKEILTKYDVGDCINSNKEMYNRAVVPVYDQNMRGMIGCTGRSIHDKCISCNAFHSIENTCPQDNEKWLSSKWRHSKNFKTQEHLYNYWFSKKYILNSKTVVIVESPGNVWRLEEAGIHNSVAIFGSSLSHKQKAILDTSGAMNIVTIMDNDKAGQDAAKQIEDKCGRIYNIKHIQINKNDIADMSIKDIHEQILPQIKEYELC